MLVNTTKDVLIPMDGEDGVTVLGCHSVPKYQNTRVLVTAGTIIGVTEINEQQPQVNTTEDVLINMAGLVHVIALDRQFAEPNQELAIRI